MASEVGQGYVSITPSARGFASKLQREIGSDLARAGRRGGEDYGKGFERSASDRAKRTGSGLHSAIGPDARRAGDQSGEDFGKAFADSAVDEAGSQKVSSGIGDKLKLGLAGAGVVAGAALVAGTSTALERGKLDSKLAAQLGRGPQTKRATKVSADLFAGAWGDSVGDVNDAVASVVTNIGGMRHATQRELKGVSRSVLDIAGAFDEDSNAITRAADQLVRTNLAKGPRQALDIITKGFQSGANEADDLLDTYTEYGTQFRKLGFDGKEATGLLSQGLKAGARDADVVADAFKEFSIRAVDGSDTTRQGFDALGLSAKDMAEKIGHGGKSAADATGLVLEKLRKVKDPADRAQVAVKLFGTQSEDLGDALFALDPSHAVDTLGKVRGAANRMGDDLNDNASTRVTEFKRTLQSDFVGFLGDKVVPAADKAYKAFKKMPAPARHTAEAVAGIGALGTGGAFLGAKFLGAIGTAKDALAGFGRKAGSVGDSVSGTRSQYGKFAKFLLGPWGLAIGAGVLAVGALWTANQDAKKKVQELTDSLNHQTGAVTRNTAQQVINAAQKEGLYAKAAKVGISGTELTRALLGEDKALKDVNHRLSTTIDRNSEWVSTGLTSSHVTKGLGRDAVQLRVALDNQTGALGKSREAWRLQKDRQTQSNRVMNNTRDLWGDTTKNLRLNKEQLGHVTGALDLTNRKERTLNQALRGAESAAADAGQKEGLHKDQLRNVAKQAGLTKGETQELIRKYDSVPKKVTTDVEFHTKEAENRRNNFLKQTKGAFQDLGNNTYAIMVNGTSGHGRLFEADGGIVRFANGGVERHVAQIARPGTTRVWAEPETGGEAYIPLSQSKRPRSLDIWAQTGRELGVQGFADGGITGRVNTKVNLDLSELKQTVRDLIESLRSRSGSVPATMAWVRRQVGKPYGWGKVGPSSYDCSGFMSAITNHLLGRSPYSRLFTTGSFPTSMFARGLGTFSIGSTANAGGGVGHMAGTLGGVNVESSGDVGVHMGGGARGATNPMFGGNIWHLKPGLIKQVVTGGGSGDPAFMGRGGPLNRFERLILGAEGGSVTSNNPDSTAFGIGQLLESNRIKYARRLGLNWRQERGDTGTTDYGAQLAMMRAYVHDRYGTSRAAWNFHLSHGTYDRGLGSGPLRPGWTMAYNGTGKNETVRTHEQEQALHRRRRGPVRIELDIGGGRVLTGMIRDEVDQALDFEASTGRM